MSPMMINLGWQPDWNLKALVLGVSFGVLPGGMGMRQGTELGRASLYRGGHHATSCWLR